MKPHGIILTLVRTFFMFVTSLMILSTVITNFAVVASKYDSQLAWSNFSTCVDDYTAISEDQLASSKTMNSWAIVAVVLGVIIFVIQSFFMTFQWVLYCKHD